MPVFFYLHSMVTTSLAALCGYLFFFGMRVDISPYRRNPFPEAEPIPFVPPLTLPPDNKTMEVPQWNEHDLLTPTAQPIAIPLSTILLLVTWLCCVVAVLCKKKTPRKTAQAKAMQTDELFEDCLLWVQKSEFAIQTDDIFEDCQWWVQTIESAIQHVTPLDDKTTQCNTPSNDAETQCQAIRTECAETQCQAIRTECAETQCQAVRTECAETQCQAVRTKCAETQCQETHQKNVQPALVATAEDDAERQWLAMLGEDAETQYLAMFGDKAEAECFASCMQDVATQCTADEQQTIFATKSERLDRLNEKLATMIQGARGTLDDMNQRGAKVYNESKGTQTAYKTSIQMETLSTKYKELKRQFHTMQKQNIELHRRVALRG